LKTLRFSYGLLKIDNGKWQFGGEIMPNCVNLSSAFWKYFMISNFLVILLNLNFLISLILILKKKPIGNLQLVQPLELKLSDSIVRPKNCCGEQLQRLCVKITDT